MARYVLVKFEKDEDADQLKECIAADTFDAPTPDEIIYYTESLTEMWQKLVEQHG